MKTLLGFLCAIMVFITACNTQPEEAFDTVAENIVEPISAISEELPAAMSELKEELQDLEGMLKTHLDQLDESMVDADQQAKEDLSAKQKEIQSFSNKVGLQLQKLGRSAPSDLHSFKETTQELFDQIESYFEEDSAERILRCDFLFSRIFAVSASMPTVTATFTSCRA